MQPDTGFSATSTQLDDYVRPLQTHRRVIVLVALISLGFGVVASLAAPHSYTSSAAILINPISADPTATLESTDSSDDLVTEVRIASSLAVMEAASENLAQQSILITAETLEEQTHASAAKASRVIDIAYTASDPAVAQAGAAAVAQSYLDFRTALTETNKQAARDALNGRITALQDQLAGIESRLRGLADGSSAKVLVVVEQSTIQGELSAQQAALADLSTVTAGGTTIIDRPQVPRYPNGLTGVQTAVGAAAGGLVLGVVIAYILAAYGSDPKPSRRRRRGAVEQPAGDDDQATVAEPSRSEPADADELLRTLDAQIAAASTSSPGHDLSGAPSPEPTAPVTVESVPAPAVESVPAPVVTSATVIAPAPAPSTAPPATAPPATAPPATAPPATAPPGTVSPAPLGELDPRPTPIVTAPAPEAPEATDMGPATWDDVASSVPSGFAAMALEEAAQQPAPVPPAATAVAPTLNVAQNMDGLLDHLRTLGAKGPVSTLTLSDGSIEMSLAIGLDVADELHALGARVLVIDALVERPSLGQLFDDQFQPGLDEVLTGRVTLHDAARNLPGLEGLDALSINPASVPATATLAGGSFERLLAEARLEYHAIVIIAGSTDDRELVPALAPLVDGLVVGTELAAGPSSGTDLVNRLAALPAPTFEVLTSPLNTAPPVAVAAGM